MKGARAVILCAVFAACGGKSPAAPTPPPKVGALSATVTAAKATFKSVTSAGAQFEVSGEVTLRESGGVAVTIQRVTGTVLAQPGNQTITGTLTDSVQIAASGTSQQQYTQPFTISFETTSAVWRFTATGIDASGNAVTATAAEVAIVFPEIAPPPSAPGPDRIKLFGGNDYSVYLGCWNCNEFDSESIFNRFGNYGSAFSSTSINNQFSQYGSPFASTSACNQFASNPPILVDSRSFYGELTLNTIRPRAINNTTVLAALRALCAS